jgi:ATP-dependent DNA helicase PIF1
MKLNSIFQDKNSGTPGWIVVVLAPTGIAAYNVNGLTIHRFFKLPVFGNSDYDKHWPLSDGVLKTIRQILPNLKCVIIGIVVHNSIFRVVIILINNNFLDEISMVSNVRLAQIHLRLDEIFGKDSDIVSSFGNVHMFLLGDLLQVIKILFLLAQN